MGLLDAEGAPLPTRLEGENAAQPGTRVLRLTQPEQHFTFVDVPSRPTPSLLRDFSAPVKLAPLPRERLLFLAAHDQDAFVAWESLQQYATRTLLEATALLAAGGTMVPDDGLIEAIRAILRAAPADPAFAAEALTLPSEAYLADQMACVDVDHIHQAREYLRARIGLALQPAFAETYASMQDPAPYTQDGAAIGRRALKNTCLGYLCAAGQIDLVQQQYAAAANMTDVLAALSLLNTVDRPEREAAFADFHEKWRHDDLVLDKWFALQAMSPLPHTITRVRALAGHPDFSWRNPNRMRALVASFAMANQINFHAADGAGYAFLTDAILKLDAINSQVAARMVPPLGQWRRHEPIRQRHMQAALQRLLDSPTLSPATREMASRSTT
jgi:aminopeptidase N